MSDGPDFNKIMTLFMVEEKARLGAFKAIREEAMVELNKLSDELVKVQAARLKKEQEEAAKKAAEEAKARDDAAKQDKEPEEEGNSVRRRI